MLTFLSNRKNKFFTLPSHFSSAALDVQSYLLFQGRVFVLFPFKVSGVVLTLNCTEGLKVRVTDDNS